MSRSAGPRRIETFGATVRQLVKGATVEREFLETMKDLRGGALPSELTEALGIVVAAVRLTGKGGSLTLTLEIDPLRKAGENTVIVTDTIKLKVPQQEKPTTILYADEDNSLTRKDPRQPELTGLRTVGGTVSPIRGEREANNG